MGGVHIGIESLSGLGWSRCSKRCEGLRYGSLSAQFTPFVCFDLFGTGIRVSRRLAHHGVMLRGWIVGHEGQYQGRWDLRWGICLVWYRYQI